VGSHIQKIRQRNSAETHGNLNLKKKNNNDNTKPKRKKNAKKKCALDVPRIRSAHGPYLIHFLAMLWDCVRGLAIFEKRDSE
jgi:hypothetical protein